MIAAKYFNSPIATKIKVKEESQKERRKGKMVNGTFVKEK